MLMLNGDTRGEYLHIECVKCGEHVQIFSLGWVGGVPEMEVNCRNCDESGSLKLNATAWIEAIPQDQ